MSHFTTIQTQIKDIEALRDACAELGLRLVPDSNCRGYGGVVRPAPHVIKLNGPYDIAVDPPPGNNGTIGLTTDWWDGHVAREVGENYGRLLQAYGVNKTIREARLRGLRTIRRNEADGTVLLTLEGGSL